MPTAGCDPEVLRAEEQARACLLRRAGLVGPYAAADCDLGRDVWRRASEEGRGTYLWGEPGTGKTYAACCAARLAVESGMRARKATAKRLLDEVKEGWDQRDPDVMRRFEGYDLLVLDDLGTERPTPWAMEELTRLIDARAEEGRPTVVTSNYRIGALRDMWGGMEGKRVASRLAGACESVEVAGPDRRLGCSR